MRKAKCILLLSFLAISFMVLSSKGMMQEASASLMSGDYVIVTTNDIVAHSTRLEGFIELKEKFGYSVKVVTETEFDGLTGQAPNGRAEKIRQWIIDNYALLGTKYVLLIGNPDPDDSTNPSDSVGDIPMKMCWPSFSDAEGREIPTDFFYADLTGNWDLDGDLYYGESTWSGHSVKPSSLSDGDTFSIRWIGKVDAEFTEEYWFRTFTDDGVRLWIDGDLIIGDWAIHPPKVNDASKLLTAGQHSIMMDYFENTGDALVRLFWKSEHQTQNGWNIIPKERLIHGGVPGGLIGWYYDNIDFTDVKSNQLDETIDFQWLTGDNGPGGVDFHAEVYVGRIPVYDNDYAQLDHILQKMINYETEQGNLNWRKKILLPTYPSNEWTPGWHLQEAIKTDIADPDGFVSYRIYNSSYGTPPPPCELTPCNPQNVENEWKKGYGIVTWWTHGNKEGASGIFASSQCPNLDDSKPSFVFQGSCSNAYPEIETNLAYSLLKSGAIATVAATRPSIFSFPWTTPDPNYGMNPDLAYYYTKNIIQDEDTAGKALFQTKDLDPNVGCWRNLQAYNLYGDPAVSLFETVINNPPVADAGGPYVRVFGSDLTLDASGCYDPDGDKIIEYEWDLDDDGVFEVATVNPMLGFGWVVMEYSTQITLRVTDALGASSTDTATLWIFGVSVSVSPSYQEIIPGNVGSYFISVENVGNVVDVFDLSLSGLPASWSYDFSSNSFLVSPYTTLDVTLDIEPYRHWSTSPGDYLFTITAIGGFAKWNGLDANDSMSAVVHILPFHEVEVSLAPLTASLKPGQSSLYDIEVTNLGNVPDVYNVALLFDDFGETYEAFPTAIQPEWTTLDALTIALDPGNMGVVTLNVTVPPNWAGMEAATYTFKASITCQADPSVNDKTSAALKVQATKRSMAEYVRLEIQRLKQTVNDANIKEELKNGLVAKLVNAEAKVSQAVQWIIQGREGQANNMLSAAQAILQGFISEVKAQSGKGISPAIAQIMIQMAQNIQQDIQQAKNTPL